MRIIQSSRICSTLLIMPSADGIVIRWCIPEIGWMSLSWIRMFDPVLKAFAEPRWEIYVNVSFCALLGWRVARMLMWLSETVHGSMG